MDAEQTFIRVQERFSQLVTPRLPNAIEYFSLFAAITLFCVLVVMHANFVQQPGCSSELSGVQTSDAQLIYIKITGAGLLTQYDSEPYVEHIAAELTTIDRTKEPAARVDDLNLFAVKDWFTWVASGARRGKLNLKFWRTYDELFETQSEDTIDGRVSKLANHDLSSDREEPYDFFSLFAKQPVKAVFLHFIRKWHRRLSFVWKHGTRLLGSLWVFI